VGRLARAVGPGLLAFATYIVFSGSVHPLDLLAALLVGATVGLITANLVVREPRKLLQLERLGWLIAYAIHYFFVDEVRAHLDVMRRIVHPAMPINPGIVRVPYTTESDYATTAVANSITNTPGTVVVDIDPEKRIFYVHWIDVKALEPEETRRRISLTFERFAKRVFD